MNRFLIIKISFLVIFVLIILNSNIGISISDNMINYTNLTYNINGRAILFCDGTRYATMTLLYKGNATGPYIIATNDLLRYVYGTKFEKYVAEKLRGTRWVVLAAKCGLQKRLDIARNGSTLFIYVNADKCYADIPVIVNIYGRVHIERVKGGYSVDVEFNASMPLDPSVRRRFSLIDASCIPGRIALKLFNGGTVRLHSRWLVNGSGTSHSINSSSVNNIRSIRWQTPFLIIFPRNANEIRKIIEKRIEIQYMNTSLQFTMLNISVRRAQYGRPTKWVTVSVIKAIYAYYGYYTALRQAILPLTTYPYKLHVAVPVIHGKPFEMLIGSHGDLSVVYDIIINALVNGSINIEGYKDASLLVPIYNVILSEPDEPPYLLYHYMYPVSFNHFPVVLNMNGTKLLLGLEADAVYPPWFDPYAVNIGFYGPRRAGCGFCKYVELLPLLIVGAAAVAIVILARKRR